MILEEKPFALFFFSLVSCFSRIKNITRCVISLSSKKQNVLVAILWRLSNINILSKLLWFYIIYMVLLWKAYNELFLLKRLNFGNKVLPTNSFYRKETPSFLLIISITMYNHKIQQEKEKERGEKNKGSNFGGKKIYRIGERQG